MVVRRVGFPTTNVARCSPRMATGKEACSSVTSITSPSSTTPRAPGSTLAGIGVERIFPLHSPSIRDMQVVRKGRVRRAKLYYLRGLKGKAARIREKRTR